MRRGREIPEMLAPRGAGAVLAGMLACSCVLGAAGVLGGCGEKPVQDKRIRIGVTVYDQYDTFIGELMEDFLADADLEKDRVTVETMNAAKSQPTQDKQVEQMVENGCDVICVNLVDRTAPSKIIDTARKNDVPIIFFNRELVEEDLLSWDRLYYVGADATQSGVLQGKLTADYLKSHPRTDRNGDGIIQYVMLEGEAGHQDAIVRSESCINTMLERGVSLEKLGYGIANWNRVQAQTKMSQMMEQYGKRIELVISNNDDMALGAIDACRQLDLAPEKRPAIVGIDGTSPGLDAVESGEMIGTVFNDKAGQAHAMFRLARALALGEVPLAGGEDVPFGEYELLDGKYIRLPYERISPSNVGDYR